MFQEAGASARFTSALRVFDDVKTTFRDEVQLAEQTWFVSVENLNPHPHYGVFDDTKTTFREKVQLADRHPKTPSCF